MITSRLVTYTDTDVLTAAKQRIRHTLDIFDDLWVAFSGGKDSLTTLLLTEQVYKEEGIRKPVNVFFRDEELIPDDVINFVDSYRKQTDRFNLKWFAIPLKSKKFLLGKSIEYLQWDPGREWIRQKPAWAITDGPALDQFTADTYIYETLGMKGKVAYLTGIRASESIVRFRSCVNKKNENYINATQDPRVKLVKPVYDWDVKDIFKFFYDNKVQYCPIYNNQVWNNQSLRVATPFLAEAAKNLDKVRTLYPVFFQQLRNLFPEMEVQERYWKEYDQYAAMEKYPHTFAGIHQWIDDNIPDLHVNELAHYQVKLCEAMRRNRTKAGTQGNNYGGYPVLHVFKGVLTGAFKRRIQPCKTVTQKMREYEEGL